MDNRNDKGTSTAARPESVRLKDLECICGNGNVIETGETISRKEDNDGDQVLQ